MRQTESVNVAIHNVFAHESDRTFQEVTSLQTCFPNFVNGEKVLRYQREGNSVL